MTALKLQIRPHFVLNCLKSVYAMVQTGSREDAQQLILLLSRYLRYILSFTATTTPLHTEIEQCCNYAELSSVGQNDPVEVVCEIDPELSELALAAGLTADAGGEQRQARQDDRQNTEDHDHCKAPRNGRGLHG